MLRDGKLRRLGKTRTEEGKKMSENPKVDRRDILRAGAGAVVGSAAVALLGPLPEAQAQARAYRWDVVHNIGTTVSAGGIASARAQDGSKITLTGFGTFVNSGSGGPNGSATGGGTWQTFSPGGGLTGSGSYSATRLISFVVAPGIFNPALTDAIGNPADFRPGLAVLLIAYSDGSEGTLVISCNGGFAPASIFEGITATKGYVDYWNREAPVGGVDADRTIFHVI